MPTLYHYYHREPMDTYYARLLDPTYKYYTTETAHEAEMLRDLVRELERQPLHTEDLSVGTQMMELTVRPVNPLTDGWVSVSAAHQRYTIRYGLDPAAPLGAESAMEGTTTAVPDAVAMILMAFQRTFRPSDAAEQQRRAEAQHQVWKLGRASADEQARLARRAAAWRPDSIPWVVDGVPPGESPQASLARWADSPVGADREAAITLLALVAYLEHHDLAIPRRVTIAPPRLTFVPSTDPPGAITITGYPEGAYTITGTVLDPDAPWPDAQMTNQAQRLYQLVPMLEQATAYLTEERPFRQPAQ